ncbi:ScbR family autoregulator-binding transcription factor [Rhodococcus rhodnii]|uniref:TetR family transcriptional regulator n=2 Tax=Rhodococcus rhodnii TaxID=38312 RepID=R7WHZ3_9NOCA|nr:ScbR family autoregulator-binding transcription factor [Rhodococcus rhodnii]EOM74737.1 TetR family transcriptional regulator [Rhodococcus rhodnii LMG 5362]
MAVQARGKFTRAQIVRAAAAMFDNRGYDGASLSDVVDEAGITKGALYFHFKSKSELASVVIDAQRRISMAALDQIVEEHEISPIGQIVMMSQELGRQIRWEPIVRAGIRLTLELSATSGPQEPYDDWLERCTELLGAAERIGQLVPGIDHARTARFVIGAYTGVQLVSNVYTGRTDLEGRIDDMWAIVLPSFLPEDQHDTIPSLISCRWRPSTGESLLSDDFLDQSS